MVEPAEAGASARRDAEPAVAAIVVSESPSPAIAWESFLGRQALGWSAVVVLLFATAFFLRYAFENQWIGPLGRVSMGVVAGLVLTHVGHRYYRAGWVVFSQMLTAGGVVLLYLSTYSSFGFYHLLDQRAAGAFLAVIVVETALLALYYDAPAIALMAVIGGLLSPLLMRTDRDQYATLFSYLTMLNAGAVGLLLCRAWPAVGSVALAGTQALFWAWYGENYHPAKLGWALGFQLAIFALYVAHMLLVNVVRRRAATWEDVLRSVAAPLLVTAAGYVLLEEDYRAWLGSLAIGMAALYALIVRLLLVGKADRRLALVALAIACSFVAVAIPLEARAPWVALGWAAEAAALWWFGLRIRSAPLRMLAGAFACLAILRILVQTPFDLAPAPRLVFNEYALPALAATACLLAGVAATRRFVAQLSTEERALTACTLVAGVLLVWYIESFDLASYFHGRIQTGDRLTADHATQTSLSTWWAGYATALLALGFRLRLGLLRWTALGLYALTVAKVFLLDMSGLDQIYRIVAFFVLAILLGIGAWAYQRFQPDRTTGEL
jgi:uncharacterized membrane protein